MCALSTLALAAPAPAAVFRLSDDPAAREPDIAVGGDNVAHVAWNRQLGSTSDEVVYCRVPRGASACASSNSFPLPGPLASGPDVSLMPTGELVVSWELLGIGDANNRVFAMTSTDGGATFGEPRLIGDREGTIYGWEGAVEPGPGNFSLSLLGNSGGANQGLNYSSAPLDGLTGQSAELTDDWRKAFHPSVAFVDPTTPIAAYSDLERIFYRRWSGSGDYNAAASWLPEATAPFAGTEPRLAGGPRGVYLMYADGEAPFDYWVSRYDPDANRFEDPAMVSADDGSSAIFRDFIEDANGALHAVFLERPGGTTWQLRRAVMLPGEGWRRPQRLATEDETNGNFYNLRAGAASDGGGAVVADGNSKGPIYFVPLAPVSSASGCPPTIKLGQAVVRAQTGCFKKGPGGTRVATGPVKVNGVDIEPVSGAASAAAPFKVTADPKARTLKTSAKANVRAGPVLLDSDKVAWELPAGTGTVKRLGAPDPSVFKDIGKYTKTLFEFPVKGDAELLIGKGETAKIPASFGLPALIGGVSGAVTLNTTAAGLNLDKLQITAPEAEIGLLRISNIKVTYDGENRFTGSASLQLPPAYGKPFNVGFGFEDGRFNFLHYDMPFEPMLPIVAPPLVGAPPEPLVGLDSLAIDYVDEEGSRKFTGAVNIVGGGKYAGLRAATLKGNVTLEFPASGAATIAAAGDLTVVVVPFATGGVKYSTDGLLTFGGSFGFPPPGKWQEIAGFSGSVDGFVSVADPVRFSAAGSAGAHVGPVSGSGDAVISSKGVTGCVTFPQPPPPADFIPDLGVSYKWGAAFPVPVCNVGSFKLAAPTAKAAANGTAVEVPAGLPQAAIEIAGAGGAPRVTVTAPDGSRVTSGGGTVADGRFIATEFGEAGKTYVSVGKPPAGTYTIEPAAGSVPVTGARVARGLPDPSVTGSVVGKGRRRTLRYRIRAVAGQRVTFAEQSPGGLYREFATTARARGSIRFRPAESAERRRAIVALVDQDGLPRARLDVAAFTAPRQRPLARPRLRVRRRATRLVVSWGKVARAHGYRVRVDLPRDGRRVLRFTGPRRRRISLRGLERSDSGRVAVQAIGADGRRGRAAIARLKPVKPKRGRRRR